MLPVIKFQLLDVVVHNREVCRKCLVLTCLLGGAADLNSIYIDMGFQVRGVYEQVCVIILLDAKAIRIVFLQLRALLILIQELF